MKLIPLKLLLLTIIHNSSARIEDFPSVDLRDLTKESITLCVLKIAQNFFYYGEIVTVTSPVINSKPNRNSKIQSIVLQKLAVQLKWSFITREEKKRNSGNIIFTKKSHNYVIIIREVKTLNTTLNYLQGLAWNPHAKFVIVSSEVLNNENITEIVEAVWAKKAMNFIVLYPAKQNDVNLKIYTWFPYENDDCGNQYNTSKLINHCSNGIFDDLTKVFIAKVPDDLHGCPVRVRTVIWPPYVIEPKDFDQNRSRVNLNFTMGLEVMLMNTIAEKSNFNLNYSVSSKIQNWGSISSTGEATGLFHELVKEKVDIAMSSIAASINRYAFLDSSLMYATESILWCVPKAQLKPKWLSFFLILSFDTWLFIAGTYIIVAFFTWGLSYKHRNESPIYYSVTNCYIYMFSLLTSTSVRTKPHSNHVRILFVLWVVFCLHLTALYQTVLIDFLVTPLYEKQIQTIDDIFNNHLNITYLEVSRLYFSATGDAIQRRINRDGLFCEDADKCLSEIAIYKNLSFAVPRLYLMYTKNFYTNHLGKPLFYWFKDDFISFPVHVFSYKGFPIMDRINNQIGRITQTGILNKWQMEFKNTNKILDAVNSTDDIVDGLSMFELQGAFIIYVFGIIVAIVVFLAEVITVFFNKKFNKIDPRKKRIFIH